MKILERILEYVVAYFLITTLFLAIYKGVLALAS